MTCIVGLRHQRGVTIGGDSAGTDAWSAQHIVAEPKVFSRTDAEGIEWLFGYCGSFRMGQLLRYELELPEVRIKAENADEFVATRLVKAVRKCFADAGFQRKHDEQISGGTFLVGVLGCLYWFQDDYFAGTFVEPYAACGAGYMVALGAMHAQMGLYEGVDGHASLAVQAESTVRFALEAAERHIASVRRPWTVLTSLVKS